MDKYWGHRNKKHKKQLAFGEKPGRNVITSAHNCNIILNISHLSRTRNIESTEKVKPTFRLKVNNGEIVVLPFFFCLS